jgi:peroxiredoxin
MPKASGLCRMLLAGCLLAVVAAEASAQTGAETARPPLKDPSILLLNDAAIRAEIGLTPAESAALDVVLLEYNDLLVAIRDTGAGGAPEALRPQVEELRVKLKQVLTAPQQKRLTGLILQAQGYESLTRDDMAAKLGLSPEQREHLTTIMDDFWKASKQLQTGDAAGSAEEIKAELNKLQAERHSRVEAELDEQQAQTWEETLGEPFDFASVRTSPARAPELVDVEAWINSPPRTLAGLRGQVVVVHFFAFGCVNCINNYPWYRQWTDELADKPVAIIGIHTPETSTEEDNELLKASLAEHNLRFPVAVDKAKKNWAAWHNGVWPSVYLIDKQGRLRYWWYGELDWQGAGGHKLMRQRIDQLLAEPDPTPAS